MSFDDEQMAHDILDASASVRLSMWRRYRLWVAVSTVASVTLALMAVLVVVLMAWQAWKPAAVAVGSLVPGLVLVAGAVWRTELARNAWLRSEEFDA